MSIRIGNNIISNNLDDVVKLEGDQSIKDIKEFEEIQIKDVNATTSTNNAKIQKLTETTLNIENPGQIVFTTDEELTRLGDTTYTIIDTGNLEENLPLATSTQAGIVQLDTEVTENSQNAITSGAVYEATKNSSSGQISNCVLSYDTFTLDINETIITNGMYTKNGNTLLSKTVPSGDTFEITGSLNLTSLQTDDYILKFDDTNQVKIENGIPVLIINGTEYEGTETFESTFTNASFSFAKTSTGYTYTLEGTNNNGEYILQEDGVTDVRVDTLPIADAGEPEVVGSSTGTGETFPTEAPSDIILGSEISRREINRTVVSSTQQTITGEDGNQYVVTTTTYEVSFAVTYSAVVPVEDTITATTENSIAGKTITINTNLIPTTSPDLLITENSTTYLDTANAESSTLYSLIGTGLIQVLIPNGRNTNKTLNNKTLTLDINSEIDLPTDYTSLHYYILLNENEEIILTQSYEEVYGTSTAQIYYDKESNTIKQDNTQLSAVKIGEINGEIILDNPPTLAKDKDVERLNSSINSLSNTVVGIEDVVNSAGILSIPQNIQLELSEGYLTLKAGSIITVPYGTTDLSATYLVGSTFLDGFEVVETEFANNKFFLRVKLNTDLTSTLKGYTFISHICIRLDTKSLNFDTTTISADISGNAFYYNASSNLVQWVGTAGDTSRVLSIPIARVTLDSINGITSILNVFNGISWMGNVVFVNKGVTYSFADGRKSNGTNNFLIKTTPYEQVINCGTGNGTWMFYQIYDLDTDSWNYRNGTTGGQFYQTYTPNMTTQYGVWENPAENLIYLTGDYGATWYRRIAVPIGRITTIDGAIFAMRQYFPLSYPSLTGNEVIQGFKTYTQSIIIQDPDIVSVPQVASDFTILGNGIEWRLADGTKLANLITYHNENNNLGCGITLYRKVDGTTHQTSLQIGIGLDGDDYMNFPKCVARPSSSSTANVSKASVVVANYYSGNNGWIRFSDGLKVQWGRVNWGSQGVKTVTFRQAFTSASSYAIFKNYGYSGTGTAADREFSFYSKTTTSAQTYIGDNSSGSYFDWFAIGY